MINYRQNFSFDKDAISSGDPLSACGGGERERCWMKDHPHLNPPPSRGRRRGERGSGRNGEKIKELFY